MAIAARDIAIAITATPDANFLGTFHYQLPQLGDNPPTGVDMQFTDSCRRRHRLSRHQARLSGCGHQDRESGLENRPEIRPWPLVVRRPTPRW